MSAMDNAVNMDNSEMFMTILQNSQLNHPHPSESVWCITNAVVPMDEGAGICYVVHAWKGEEAKDMGHIHAFHSLTALVNIDQDSVIVFNHRGHWETQMWQ